MGLRLQVVDVERLFLTFSCINDLKVCRLRRLSARLRLADAVAHRSCPPASPVDKRRGRASAVDNGYRRYGRARQAAPGSSWPPRNKFRLNAGELSKALGLVEPGCWVRPCVEGEALGGGRSAEGAPLPLFDPPAGGLIFHSCAVSRACVRAREAHAICPGVTRRAPCSLDVMVPGGPEVSEVTTARKASPRGKTGSHGRC